MRISILLSSHVRRARSFQSAVHCFASSLAAPIGADQNPSYMDADEEAGTTASLDHIIARLRTLEAADQVRNASDLSVVVNLRSEVVHRAVGDPSNPTDQQALCGFHHGGLKPCVRFADSRESRVCCGICFFQSSHARSILSSRCRQCHRCSLHRSSHTLGLTQERRLGGWDDRWSNSCVTRISSVRSTRERSTRYFFFEPASQWICARMTKDPTTSAPSAMKFKVVAPSERVFSVWFPQRHGSRRVGKVSSAFPSSTVFGCEATNCMEIDQSPRFTRLHVFSPVCVGGSTSFSLSTSRMFVIFLGLH